MYLFHSFCPGSGVFLDVQVIDFLVRGTSMSSNSLRISIYLFIIWACFPLFLLIVLLPVVMRLHT